MAAPEGYELLARIGFVDRGNYSASATYLAGDVVYYNGSTWTALKDNLKGVTPAAGANWKYMARGFAAELLRDVQAVDTSGLKGTAGSQVDAQALIDAIADRVATKLLLKTDVTSQIINDAAKAASAAALYSVNESLKQTNSNLTSIDSRFMSYGFITSLEIDFSALRAGLYLLLTNYEICTVVRYTANIGTKKIVESTLRPITLTEDGYKLTVTSTTSVLLSVLFVGR